MSEGSAYDLHNTSTHVFYHRNDEVLIMSTYPAVVSVVKHTNMCDISS